MNRPAVSVFWFRRDLRLYDNAGLYYALQSGFPVLPIFIFDRHILDALEDRDDARVSFIHDQLTAMHRRLLEWGSGLTTGYDTPLVFWEKLLEQYDIRQVFFNRDYEPYALERDRDVSGLLVGRGIGVNTFKDHVIFEKEEILNGSGQPYTVFTPYSRKWMSALRGGLALPPDKSLPRLATKEGIEWRAFPSESLPDRYYPYRAPEWPDWSVMGFVRTTRLFPSVEIAQGVIRHYAERRNFPGIEEGTSRLGLHYRFGTVSIREKLYKALDISDTYVNELIWRDFFSMILAHFPEVVSRAFRPAYDRIEWRDDPDGLERWKQGRTGYPLVDAGMRELMATGYQHNRVRMVTASFLTKHLLIDWRLGEAWFARKLLDFDLASNNGNWQWAAGCGTDAAPYFRIFNPVSQQEKFDADLIYVRKWVPEYGTSAYVKPIVEHSEARERCLTAYKKALHLT